MMAGTWSCGATDVVRPNDITAAEAVGERFECSEEKLRDQLEPFIVDWSDGDRAALESEMGRGVALVRMTCEGMKVLKGCAGTGDYEYRGVSRKTKLVEMEDRGTMATNFGGLALPGSFEAELKQGRSLVLAYVIAGMKATSVPEIVQRQIKAQRCKAATHFVYDAQVGAFAMETASRGEGRTAASVLGLASMEAEAESEKRTRTTDGDANACQGSTARDRIPHDGCQALMRVSLLPISRDESLSVEGVSTREAAGCPAGLVYNAQGLCVRPGAAQAYLCREGDAEGCAAQCEAGSQESCGRFAGLVLDRHTSTIGKVLRFDELAGMAEPRSSELRRACDEGVASACTVSALLAAGGVLTPLSPTVPGGGAAFVRDMENACAGGEGRACAYVIAAYGKGAVEGVEKNPRRLNQIVEGACLAGSGRACWLYGQYLYDGVAQQLPIRSEGGVGAGIKETLQLVQEPGNKKQLQRAVDALERGCTGGVVKSCLLAGIAYKFKSPPMCLALMAPLVQAWDLKGGDIYRTINEHSDALKYCTATMVMQDAQKAQKTLELTCYQKEATAITKAACAAAGVTDVPYQRENRAGGAGR